jgi:hypothetical protein
MSVSITWPSGPIPPLPVRCGCYLVNYNTLAGITSETFDGTLRVECNRNGLSASGDLYQRQTGGRGPNPAQGIPILARADYRYYLSVTRVPESLAPGNSFTFGFKRWRFNRATANTPHSWTDEGHFTALMYWLPASAGYPSSRDYLEGEVKDNDGTPVGRLTMGWVSSYLRKATIEIDRVAEAQSPLDNGAGVNWRDVGDSVDWDITVDRSDSNVAEPSDGFWSDAECHEKMLALRDRNNLDAEWRYHILCVRRLDSTERGLMYDYAASDSDKVPREGCAISSHWPIPKRKRWGTVKGMRFGMATAPYFRTAVHEIGHAMGLYHNYADNGYMCSTPDILDSRNPHSPVFPNNILWTYNAEDAKRLRHLPDIQVRPGGTPFSTDYPKRHVVPMDRVELAVSPLLKEVPLGAPVRVKLRLAACGDALVEVPSAISLGSGCVRGYVTDSDGAVRTFSPLVLSEDKMRVKVLHKGESVTDSLTLLRGAQKALFPVGGDYTIRVEVRWDVGGVEVAAAGETTVTVTPAADSAHAEAARMVLETPDTLLTLVIGGTHLKDGIAAIRVALANPVLQPHFAYVEAKRLATERNPDLKAAADLIDDAAVLSRAEIKTAATFVKKCEDPASAQGLAARLKAKEDRLSVDDEGQGDR